jgi:hypothetical protein
MLTSVVFNLNDNAYVQRAVSELSRTLSCISKSLEVSVNLANFRSFSYTTGFRSAIKYTKLLPVATRLGSRHYALCLKMRKNEIKA